MAEDGARGGDMPYIAENAGTQEDAVEGCTIEAFCDEVCGGGVVEGEGFGGEGSGGDGFEFGDGEDGGEGG